MSDDNQTIEGKIAYHVSLIIDNEESIHNQMIELAKKHSSLIDLGEAIKDWIQENLIDGDECPQLHPICYDLLDSAVTWCNWEQVAGSYKENLRPEGTEYTIYEGFMSALINGDYSGLEEEEEEQFKEWYDTENFDESKGSFWYDSDEESEYTDCEIKSVFADCVTVVWVAREAEKQAEEVPTAE